MLRPMPLFSDEQDVYTHLGKLFEDLAADASLASQLKRADTVVQYAYSDPDARITLRLLAGDDPVAVAFGDTEWEPEVVLSMPADTGHRVLLGKVNLTVALARGEIKTKGPVAKILKLVPLVKPALPRYQAQLAEAGREDLVTA